ncbi:MAG: hypothetical protein FWF15_05550 [Oscillospiraceae bacterium]|nr:hypothetical protein [Oscillospiraceae bacterium]
MIFNLNQYKTKDFIEILVAFIDQYLPCYYEYAPSTAAPQLYAVANGFHESDISYGCLTNFYIDLYTDEKIPNATENLEVITDKLRSAIANEIFTKPLSFYAHVGVDNRINVHDKEFDLCNRKITCTARIFYY